MFRDPLVKKAWELCQTTAQCPFEVILEATVWLEEHYQRTPHVNTALMISLHYLVLAMRQELRTKPLVAKNYFSRSIHWREEAGRQLEERKAFPVPEDHN